MQRCFTYAVALAATGGLDLASTSAAWAQGIQCPGPAIIKPFDGDANSVRGIAGATRLTVQACARGYLSVIAGSYVEQINPELAPSGTGFTSGVEVFPCGGTGRGSDLPGTRLEVGFFSADRLNLMAEAGAAFTLAADDKAPKIKITPPSGTKVTAGQRMTISVAASERYEDGNKNWQTGVKSIRVEDLTRHEGLPPWDNGNARPQSGASKTWSKTHEMPFTVPRPAAPMVRLRASVKDYAGNETTRTIVYPTGDWFGTLEWSFEETTEGTPHSTGGNSRRRGQADLVLKQNRRGTVEGLLLGGQTMENLWAYSDMHSYCRFRTAGPNEVRAKLDGAYEESRGHPMFQASEFVATVEQVFVEGRKCTSPPVRTDMSQELSGIIPVLVHKLERTGDGSFIAR